MLAMINLVVESAENRSIKFPAFANNAKKLRTSNDFIV